MLMVVGILLLMFPENAGARVANFYSKYPIVRHANYRQFGVRPVVMRLLGGVFLGIGVIGLVSVFIPLI